MTPSTLVRLRRQRGLTQEALAAELGVSFATVNRWERGRFSPSPAARRRLTEWLKEYGPTRETWKRAVQQNKTLMSYEEWRTHD